MDKEALDRVIEKVSEKLKAEGGGIEVIGVKNDMLYVKLLGSCETCPMSGLTMKNWVEKTILEALPSLKGVKAV
ncbi:MAG: NifU family protein [Nitrospirota bacterium]|uniref:Fe/S biogenesis protein NfuA n=1 Tax=Candidatus Magnetominusculus xianensis TaxID=1748249 RepID=A0ABR5SGS1_9BACT|nr:NifU family protein [Candidatus Magnetominusculus xianensis]KWT90513.1 Fe/S biogenesis protein NfuA [Candidatus Magnetominusculus xianensis]MBF0404161.1 NifU family protein [Nitrospirota bacterium]